MIAGRDEVYLSAIGIKRKPYPDFRGVTTFYNPPARQLWFDRVRPFLDKHSPKKLAP